MTPVEPNPGAVDGPQEDPSEDEDNKSRETFKEWESGQKEHGEHRVPRSDR